MSKPSGRVSAALLLLLTIAGLGLSENEDNATNRDTSTNGGISFEGWVQSMHEPTSHALATGTDWVLCRARCYPTQDEGVTWKRYIYSGFPASGPTFATKECLHVEGATPLAASLDGDADRATQCPPSTETWYIPWATAKRSWGPLEIEKIKMGEVAYSLGTFIHPPAVKQWCHTKKKVPQDVAVGLANPPGNLATLDELSTGGNPQIEEQEDGAWEPVLDAGGQLTWFEPPEIKFRLTSSAAVGTAQTATSFTYTLENLTDENAAFSFSAISSSSYPDGWCGTVAANASATLTISLAQAEACYYQTSSSEFTIEDRAYHTPVTVVVPSSRREYVGSFTVTAAGYNGGTSSNVITFEVTTQSATTALLYRIVDGDLELVATSQGVFAVNQCYSIADATPPIGTTEYILELGRGTNGNISEEPISVTR